MHSYCSVNSRLYVYCALKGEICQGICQYYTYNTREGHAITQVIGRRLLTVEHRFNPRASQCGIYGEQCDIGVGLSFVSYHSICAPFCHQSASCRNEK
jgi:hypothetical protein